MPLASVRVVVLSDLQTPKWPVACLRDWVESGH